MSRVSLSIPTDDKVRFVLENLSEDDRGELNAVGADPLDQLGDFFEALDEDGAMGGCIEIDGAPAAIYGVRRSGVIWMVGTEKVKSAPHAVARVTESIVTEARERWPILFNRVWCHHARAINWLKWLGFHLADDPDDEGFIPFYMESEQCAAQ